MMQNILFDIDDTLLDFKKCERFAIRDALSQIGVTADAGMISRYSEINRAKWQALERGELTREQVLTTRFEQLFSEYGISASPEAVWKLYEHALSGYHFFTDKSTALLSDIVGKCRMYAVSNATVTVQKRRLSESGLDKFFDAVFISGEVGYEKPDARFFAYCFERIPDFDKDLTVIVGDSLSSDIKGGHESGIKTVWYNPNGKQNNTDTTPDYTVYDLMQVKDILGIC